ncbi:aquaporin [Pararhizobium sp. YC-54]|uniref:aquaporin n=1 Tax=Pararhizobium sp. YC-54 TaxID=2986920 RepID=UPI0021F6BB4C|nr:aquaporin [Pararhizobium sp. YC-54]MCV9999351.1 aquaporin [Pararhizobium sp. YC-54]
MKTKLTHRLFAEVLGTCILTASVVGSALMADRMTDIPALVMLCVAVSCAAALFVLLELLGPISGGHFNPAVSLAMCLQGRVTRYEAAAYISMQTIGGLLGVVLVHGMFDLPAVSLGVQARTGLSIWLAETASTFGLVFAILFGLRFRPQSVSAIVGIYVLSVTLFAASSFANPATTMARALTATLAGIRPTDVPAFIIAQFLGAMLAVGLARWLTSPSALTAQR